MRVSTSQIYTLANIGMSNAQQAVNKTSEQMSTQKRVLSPADDPVAATMILRLNQTIARTEQFDKNIDVAQNNLDQEEAALNSVVNLLQRMRELAVKAGNTGVLTPQDYQSIAAEVDSRIDELLGLQNTRNVSGQYIFGGHQGNTQPFTMDEAGNLAYHGDEGQLEIQISESVSVPVADSGKRLFMDIQSNHNTFVTHASESNRADPPARISAGEIIDQEAYDEFFPSDMKVSFNSPEALSPAAANFTITDRATGKVLLENEPYQPGKPVELNGLRFHITGQPQSGTPATPGSIDFGTVGAVNFGAPPGSPASIKVSVGGVSETLILDRNVTNAADLAAALSSSTDNVPGSGAANNAAKLANLGITVDNNGFSAASGLNVTVGSGSAATDTALGFSTQNDGTSSTNGESARPGDSFFVEATDKESLITTLSRFSEAMRSVEANPESKAELGEVVAKTLGNLDNALTNVISVQGELGARLNTLESGRNINADAQLYNSEVLSQVQDLDYAKASTRLAMESFVLQAAQQSFVKVSKLSLFNFL